MTTLEIIAASHVIATIAIGLGQIGIVWVGIRAMNRASAERARDRTQAARVADQRHAETLQTADQRHAETLQTADQRHAEAMTALRALIARTAPAAE